MTFINLLGFGWSADLPLLKISELTGNLNIVNGGRIFALTNTPTSRIGSCNGHDRFQKRRNNDVIKHHKAICAIMKLIDFLPVGHMGEVNKSQVQSALLENAQSIIDTLTAFGSAAIIQVRVSQKASHQISIDNLEGIERLRFIRDRAADKRAALHALDEILKTVCCREELISQRTVQGSLEAPLISQLVIRQSGGEIDFDIIAHLELAAKTLASNLDVSISGPWPPYGLIDARHLYPTHLGAA